ncbi:MAG: dihydrofolate reductase [Thermoplasmata archaeon]|jgi:dihydrofolate reductase|nr:dihydrofolate reductase [Thermoplasmata archaeon]
MIQDVEVRQAPTRILAAVPRRVRPGEVAAAWRPALDQVWAFLRASPGLGPHGQNVFLYRQGAGRDALLEAAFGVEVPRAFEPSGEVRPVTTPAGRVVSALHVGPYDALREAHDAVHAYAASHGLRFAGVSWEVYGHPTPDPAKTETRVEYLLAPRVHLIAAVAKNGVIGQGGKMPWHLSDDLKRFKALTMGHPIVLGRKTWDSLGRPLPGRTNIVVSRSASGLAGATVVRSLDEALATCAGASDVFVIGGGEIYREALPRADVLDLTRIDREYEGDTRFPDWDRSAWRETAREEREGYAFVTYERGRQA